MYHFYIVIFGLFGSMLSTCGSRTNGINSAGTPDAFEKEKAYQAEVLANGYQTNDGSYAGQDVVELKREPDGHFYADVEINNMPIRILVDTGASGIALTRDDARRAGLSVPVGMFDVVGEGASGDVKGDYAMLDTVRLGKRYPGGSGRHPRRRQSVAARPELPSAVRLSRDQERPNDPALRRFPDPSGWSSRAKC